VITRVRRHVFVRQGSHFSIVRGGMAQEGGLVWHAACVCIHVHVCVCVCVCVCESTCTYTYARA